MPKKTKTIPLFFIKVYEFLNDYDLSPADKILYGLIENGSKKNICRWNNSTLVLYSSISPRQINTSLLKLQKRKLIKVKQYGKSREIRINKEKLEEELFLNSNFMKVYTSVLMDFNLTLNEKFIYSIIRNMCKSKSSKCLLIPKEVCTICGCSTSTYYVSINNLNALSYIKLNTKNDVNKLQAKIMKDLWPKISSC